MASQFDIEVLANQAVPLRTSESTYSTLESEPPFAKSIRDASVLLATNDPYTYDRLRTITIDTFHRVYARIAAKKITNSNFVYNEETAYEIMRYTLADSTANFTKEEEAEKIRYARYSGAIRSIVRRIASAELVRYIALDSSLKFKDVADKRIEEAFEDLDRILEVVASNVELSSSVSKEEDLTKGQVTVYLAYELNKADIPESEFDKPDLDSNPPTYVAPVAIDKVVETTKQLLIPDGRIGVCHLYMTAQAYNADVDLITSRDRTSDRSGTSAGVALKVDRLIPIRNTDTIDSIISVISEAINSETLNSIYNNKAVTHPDDYLTNILVAPEYQKPELSSSFIQKKLLYPESTINERRIATFDTYYRTNKLSFETRRYSTKVDTEMLIVGFYTVEDTVDNRIFIQRDYKNQTLSSNSEFIRQNAALGIPGLVYGKGNSFAELQNNSPISLFLNVQKGNVAAVSIKDDTSGGTTTEQDNNASGGLANQIDTFYFHVNHLDENGVTITPNQPVFSSTDNELVFRISTSSYLDEPARLVTVNLSSLNYPGLKDDGSPVEINYIGEDIAALVVDALYEEARKTNLDTTAQSTNILGAQLGDFDNYYPKINLTTNTMTAIPIEDTTDINEVFDIDCGRVQIVAFRYREQEYRAVVEIIKIPKKLWVATGNYQQRRTIWEKGRRRSISIETKDLKTTSGSAAETMTEAEVLSSVNASVSETVARKSPLLQSVYDKKRLLEEIRSHETIEGYYRRPQQWLR